MTYVEPLAREAIADPEMRDLIAQSEALGVPDDLFPRIAARSPELAKPFMRALLMSHAEGNVDHRLKEIIRILLARFAGDKYFAALRSRKAREMGLDEERIEAGCSDYEDSDLFTEAEKCALRYADQMYLDATKVDAAFTPNSRPISPNRKLWNWARSSLSTTACRCSCARWEPPGRPAPHKCILMT